MIENPADLSAGFLYVVFICFLGGEKKGFALDSCGKERGGWLTFFPVADILSL